MNHHYREIREIHLRILTTNFQQFFTIYLIITVSTHTINQCFCRAVRKMRGWGGWERWKGKCVPLLSRE